MPIATRSRGSASATAMTAATIPSPPPPFTGMCAMLINDGEVGCETAVAAAGSKVDPPAAEQHREDDATEYAGNEDDEQGFHWTPPL